MSYLSVQNLCIKLGDFALNSLNLELEHGDYTAIIGPTGSGKSILLECIIGFYSPEKGKVFLDNKDITDEFPENRGIGIVYQDYALLPHFTVFNNIAYGLKKKEKDKRKIKEKVEKIAVSLGIDHLLGRKPDTLSGGEQQRTALARALVVKPRLLLMDEPFSALDPGTKKDIRKLLGEIINQNGTSVIHVTHDMKDLWTLANKAVILHKGDVLQSGSVNDIFEKPDNQFVADFVGASFLDACVVSKNNGETDLKMDGFFLKSKDRATIGEKVKVAVRPEQIELLAAPPAYINGDNLITTRLTKIACEGDIWLFIV
ncbi:MAG: ATP-binding cassette domain-containing protein, partial [Thermodesulfobacteriota bacterium]|nr:ATP-binding cassette domain-containing protein [Thermodesulfobacteriota bacterium]